MPNKCEDEDDKRSWEFTGRRSKRIKLSCHKPATEGEKVKPLKAGAPNKDSIFITSLAKTPLLQEDDFEAILPKEAYLAARLQYLKDNSERDPFHNQVRSLTLSETRELERWLESSAAAGRQTWTSGESILTRRLKLRKLNKSESAIFSYDVLRSLPTRGQAIIPLSPLPAHSAPNIETLNALYGIHKTPYTSSFASRLFGSQEVTGLIHRDWETDTVWLQILADIKLHHTLSHSEILDRVPLDHEAPIDYVFLQYWHLPQLHDLLTKIFWPGIDVSDLLNSSPEKCTVVAVYRRLVVGAAFLSSPEEPYLTYLIVRPGWELANIARNMLYFIIMANPKRDITLHVSANNPAMLLYNKFGFKAEEFIVGFYDDYLPKESRSCKNAFRLRLRR